MVYFFHRYELPILISQHDRRNYDRRDSGNPSPPPSSNGEAANNQSQDPAGQLNSGEVSNSSSVDISTDGNNPSSDNSIEEITPSDVSFGQQVDTHATCLLTAINSVKYSSLNEVSSLHYKCDEISFHMPNRLHKVPKLQFDLKPKTILNVIILSFKKNIEIAIVNLKPLLIFILAVLLFSRTFTAILNTCLAKLNSYEDLRVMESLFGSWHMCG